MDPKLKRQIDGRREVLDKIKNDLITRLNLPFEPEDLHEDVSLLGSGLGLDSLDSLEVILGIEHAFGVKVADDNIAVLRSINSVADFVIAERAVKGAEVPS
jgi:acyl carrier protein